MQEEALARLGAGQDHAAAERRAEERASALVGQLRKGDMRTARVAEMVGNPLLLANLCLVHRDHGRLPEDRRRHGVILDLPVAANTTLAVLRRDADGSLHRE